MKTSSSATKVNSVADPLHFGTDADPDADPNCIFVSVLFRPDRGVFLGVFRAKGNTNQQKIE
jgi:hypothetical protein